MKESGRWLDISAQLADLAELETVYRVLDVTPALPAEVLSDFGNDRVNRTSYLHAGSTPSGRVFTHKTTLYRGRCGAFLDGLIRTDRAATSAF